MSRKSVPVEQRFWKYVLPPDANGCMLWTGAKYRNGYGAIKTGGRGSPMIGAHRLAYIIAYGSIPDSVLVCHTCDVRLCCNKDHLFTGTHKDNTQDMIRKGRSKLIPWTNKTAKSPRQKLTAQDVRDIRERYDPWVVTQQMLADEYGVSQVNISEILLGNIWKDV